MAGAEREREGKRIAERRLRGAHTALLEIERLASLYNADTREQILSEAQGALRETDPLNMRGAVKAALDRQVEQLLAGSPSRADACTRSEPTQAEMEAFWAAPAFAPPSDPEALWLRVAIRLNAGVVADSTMEPTILKDINDAARCQLAVKRDELLKEHT